MTLSLILKHRTQILPFLKTLHGHRRFVHMAGHHLTKAPTWRLLVHDLSKLRPSEFTLYLQRFAETPAGSLEKQQVFYAAFQHHTRRNPHHREHWATPVVRQNGVTLVVREIPENVLREMVADWMGAHRTQNGFWEDPRKTPWWTLEGEPVVNQLPAKTQTQLQTILNDATQRLHRLQTTQPNIWGQHHDHDQNL